MAVTGRLGTSRQVVGAAVVACVVGVVVVLSCDRWSAAEAPVTRDVGESAPAVVAEPAPAEPARRRAGPVKIQEIAADVGIFSDLDAQVEVQWPPWLPPPEVVVTHGRGRYGLSSGVLMGPLAAGEGAGEGGTVVAVSSLAGRDRDGDGLPDQLDVVVGARKAALNHARYEGGYYGLKYPGGDVPRELGVCTDVVIRAMRNAGYDLQELLHEDIKKSPRSYPMVTKANPDIDQRRVKTLLPYFVRHFGARPTDVQSTLSDWLPGDVVFMDTLPKPGPDHIGVVSDRVGPSGLPLIINNWTDGYETGDMDLLTFVPITHRFRLEPGASLKVASEIGGLEGVLRRAGLEVPGPSGQVVLVTVPHAGATRGALRRFVREGGGWRSVGDVVTVGVGRSGLGAGSGVVALEGSRPGALPPKREGDGRSPAGIFTLGTAFGRKAERGSRWPFRKVVDGDVFVDDPSSPQYNRWARAGEGEWASAEDLTVYRFGVVVEHNTTPTRPGAGSAIFLHTDAPGEVTVGCTAMPESDLRALVRWLDPDRRPVLVQVVGEVVGSPSP